MEWKEEERQTTDAADHFHALEKPFTIAGTNKTEKKEEEEEEF